MDQITNEGKDRAPDKSDVALILIDTINRLDFPGGEELLEPALAAADRIVLLRKRCRAAKIPVIYANDNFGRWREDFRVVVERCKEPGCLGRPLAERLEPEVDDYSILKPRHSAFYQTTLETLLDELGCRSLILVGFTGDMCILFTAMDAFMRHFELWIPEDCTASISGEANAAALRYIERTLEADISPSVELDLEQLRTAPRS